MIEQIYKIADTALLDEITTFPSQGFIWEIIEKQNTGKIFELSSGAILIIDNCCDPFVFIAGEIHQDDVNEIVDLIQPLKPVTLYCNPKYHAMFLKLGWDFQIRARFSCRKLRTIPILDAEVRPIRSIEIFEQCTWYKEESELYGSPENFLRNGIGYALCKGDIVVSEAYAHVGGGYAEIGVATHPEHRNRGYSAMIASYVTEEFSRSDSRYKGLILEANCDISNKSSLYLALKLGCEIDRYDIWLKPYSAKAITKGLANDRHI